MLIDTVLMKTTQILYLLLLVVAIVWAVNSTHLLDLKINEGFSSGTSSDFGPSSDSGPGPVMPAEPNKPKIFNPIDLNELKKLKVNLKKKLFKNF